MPNIKRGKKRNKEKKMFTLKERKIKTHIIRQKLALK